MNVESSEEKNLFDVCTSTTYGVNLMGEGFMGGVHPPPFRSFLISDFVL